MGQWPRSGLGLACRAAGSATRCDPSLLRAPRLGPHLAPAPSCRWTPGTCRFSKRAFRSFSAPWLVLKVSRLQTHASRSHAAEFDNPAFERERTHARITFAAFT